MAPTKKTKRKYKVILVREEDDRLHERTVLVRPKAKARRTKKNLKLDWIDIWEKVNDTIAELEEKSYCEKCHEYQTNPPSWEDQQRIIQQVVQEALASNRIWEKR